MNDIGTIGHGEFAATVTDQVNAQLPQEKERAKREMAQTAKEVKELGLVSDKVDGRGQAVCSIPPIIYMRWQQEYPGCWKDKGFVDEFLADNPQCQLPGYKPRGKALRFDISGMKLNPGGNLYQEKKLRVMAAINAQTATVNGH